MSALCLNGFPASVTVQPWRECVPHQLQTGAERTSLLSTHHAYAWPAINHTESVSDCNLQSNGGKTDPT